MVFVAHAAEIIRLDLLERVELWAYDRHLTMTMPRDIDHSIVIVDIDEASLTAEGRWPWPRNKVAKLVEQLFETYDIRIVGFDIVFAEPDESSGLGVLEGLASGALADDENFQSQLQVIRPDLDYDGIFAETIQKYPVVLGYYFDGAADSDVAIGELPKPAFDQREFRAKRVSFETAHGFGANLKQLASSALSQGHFTPTLDADGVVRRVPMLMEYEDAYYSSLSLEIVKEVLEAQEVIPEFVQPLFRTSGYPGLEWLRVGSFRIPVDAEVKALVPYRGNKGSYPYIPATEVINGVADKDALQNAIVLVGTSAPGLLDLRSTPVDGAFPGVEVHANLISGALNNTLKQAPAYTLGAEVLLLIIGGLVMIVAGTLLSPLSTSVVTVVSLVLYAGLNHLFWSAGNLVLPVASGLLLVLTIFVVHMSYGYFVETRGKRQLTGLFGQYLPPELVDEMAKSPTGYSQAAANKELSVLFSDVRGFTTLSEGLSPAELSELMNMFLTPMTRVIHESRGTIDKYMGDAIMAFWGAPVDDVDHARHAVEAGLQMLGRLREINEEFRSKGWQEIQIGVGINTGLMSVGDMGSQFRQAYTVLGDEVNLGSRLEGLTKPYGVNFIVSESTASLLPDYAFRELDRVVVKGKTKGVGIYEPLCLKTELDSKAKGELKLFRETLKLYRSQQWDMAELNLVNLKKQSKSSTLYDVYIERIADFRKSPPGADWDGSFSHTSK